MLFQAIEFAAQAHRGQFRKGTRLPSVFHGFAIAKTLIECECSDEVVVAGILHDTVEDTPVTLDEIRATFGDKVASLVDAVSEPLSELDRVQSWGQRKQHTLEALETATPEVLLIQLADKLDNIKSIREGWERAGEAVWDTFNRGREDQQRHFRALVQVFERRVTDPCGEPLVRVFQLEVEQVFGPSRS